MSDAKFNFRITAFTPETIPMSRLAEYLAQYAALMGSNAHVHFNGLRKGSTVMCGRVERDDVPKVEQRLQLASRADAPPDLVRIRNTINAYLREDNAEGAIRRDGGAQIITFPGRKQPLPERIGPIKEAGQLEGEIVRVGGKDRTKHALLIGPGGEEYKLTTTSRDMAKELGKCLFTSVRVNGTGTWFRNEEFQWELDSFTVQDFEPLSERTLIEALDGLRQIEGGEWAQMPDPLGKWRELRRN